MADKIMEVGLDHDGTAGGRLGGEASHGSRGATIWRQREGNRTGGNEENKGRKWRKLWNLTVAMQISYRRLFLLLVQGTHRRHSAQ